jgi:hypothetical protein
MKYLSGLHALNVEMPDTDGDWHQMALDWDDLPMSESNDSRCKLTKSAAQAPFFRHGVKPHIP